MTYPVVDPILYFAGCASILGIGYAFFLLRRVLKSDPGNSKMQSVASAIQKGARAYSNQQLLAVSSIVGLLTLIVGFALSPLTAVSFVLGASANLVVTILSMYISVQGNVRTAEAAKVLPQGFLMAFSSGSVIGLFVSGWALLTCLLIFCLLGIFLESPDLILDLLFFVGGSSVVSLFARLGGGIFTKGADMGADMVGKIEKSLPEDDPRNPAVIADNVGDNVGDCVGSASDVFETYLFALVGGIAILSFTFESSLNPSYLFSVCGIGVIASLVGVICTKLRGKRVLFSIYLGLLAATLSAALALIGMTYWIHGAVDFTIVGPALMGYASLWMFTLFSEYYTSFKYRPAISIANASKSGDATNIIYGMSVGMEAAFVFSLILIFSLLVSQFGVGLLGIVLSAVALVSLSGSVISMDAYGPISDNAGGIAEMSGMDSSVRDNTDVLDAVGNTTKAITKTYITGTTVMSILIMLGVYVNVVGDDILADFAIDDGVFGFIGILVGGSLPFLFSSFCMKSVGKAASLVVEEIRRQFASQPKILTGEISPDYAKTVTFLTRTAIKSMIIPGLIVPAIPFVLYLGFSVLLSPEKAVFYLGSSVVGLLLTGTYLSTSITISGGSWDNAKKYIEKGNLGGKGSSAHKSAVTGDAVGDPCKDTAGPGINPLMKITSLAAVILVTTF